MAGFDTDIGKVRLACSDFGTSGGAMGMGGTTVDGETARCRFSVTGGTLGMGAIASATIGVVRFTWKSTGGLGIGGTAPGESGSED
jgi:hypothetical protein